MYAVEVSEAISLGDCATALDLLTDEDHPDAVTADARALARGWCLTREGALDAALAALPTDGALGAYGRLVAARSLVSQGREDDALALLSGEPPPGRAGREWTLLRGRLLAPYGDADALDSLRRLSSTDVAPEAVFWLAEALGVLGDVAAAIDQFRTVWTAAQPGGWDARAAARLHELGIDLGDQRSDEGRARLEARLAGLQTHRRAEEARTLAEELYRRRAPKDRAGQLFLGRVYYDARAYPSALKMWKKALGAPKKAVGSPDELFDYALCHARTDDYDTAAVVYERLFTAHPDHDKADFASFKLGYMTYDRNECETAVADFDAHRARYPDSAHLDEALWFSSRCRWRMGQIDEAVALLDELQAKRPDSTLVSGASYWRARAAGAAGDAGAESAGLTAVLERWPNTGYGWFAATRLGRTYAAPPEVVPPEFPPDWAARAPVQRAQALLAVGLRAFARDELDQLPAPTSDDATAALAWARLAAGDYRGARRLARGVRSTPAGRWASWPRPERATVERVASEYGLDPAIAYGVMWAESALDPGVTSAVGARGLMQLMPEVGATLHSERFPSRPYDPDDLYLGPYNAALGTTELGQRLESLTGVLSHDSAPAVIGSYNAGEEAVRRWLPADGTAPEFDVWAEDVSYTETRRYIKRVLGYVMAYRTLYGDAVSD